MWTRYEGGGTINPRIIAKSESKSNAALVKIRERYRIRNRCGCAAPSLGLWMRLEALLGDDRVEHLAT
jgi:hypothetical protein